MKRRLAWRVLFVGLTVFGTYWGLILYLAGRKYGWW